MASLTVLRSMAPERDVIKPLDTISKSSVGHVYDAGGSSNSEWLKLLLQRCMFWTDVPYRPDCFPQRLLPSPLVSDKKGLQLWDQITQLPAYYQTDSEIDLFERNSAEIANYVKPGTSLIDLGCGNIRKIKPLLDTLERLQIPVLYFALDLDRSSLQRAMKTLSSAYKYVECFGLWGNFDSGLEFYNSLNLNRPRLFLSLGSIFGNDHFEAAVARLKDWKKKALYDPRDAILLTMDGTTDQKALWESYHDDQGLFEEFIRNGYRHSNKIMGCNWYHDDEWEHFGVLQDDPEMHKFVLRARKDVVCEELGFTFAKNTCIDCYEGFRYGPEMMRRQFAQANLGERACWKAPQSEIYQYLLTSVERESTAPSLMWPWSYSV